MKKGPYLLGIDGGTESLRVGIFNLEGRRIAFVSEPYPVYFPRPGFAEQDPEDWWKAFKRALSKALDQGKINPREIKAIGMDATSCTVVFTDKQGNPLRKAILWMDVRASEEAKLIAGIDDPALKYNGWSSVSAEWMPCKALWIKKNEPQIYDKSYRICEYIDWFIYKLTGKWTASINNATVRWYYNKPSGGWPKEFYKKIGLENILEKFPSEVIRLGEKVGNIRPEVAEELGLKPGISVAEGGADAYVAMLGLNVTSPEKLAFITGSSHLLLGLTQREFHLAGIFGTFPEAVIPKLNVVEGGQISTGSIIKWFKDNFCYKEFLDAQRKKLDIYDILNDKAGKLKPGSEGLIVLDHWQGNRTPYVDPKSRGVIWGLSLRHTPFHLFRAIMEGIAYGTENILRTFKQAGFEPKEIFACGGATKSKLWMQIHSDVSNIPIYIPKETEAACLGSVILASVSGGYYSSLQEASEKMVKIAYMVEPNSKNHEIYKFYVEKYIQTYEKMRELSHELVKYEQAKKYLHA